MGLFDNKQSNKNELNNLVEKITARAGNYDDVINYFNSENINNTELVYKEHSYTPLQLAIKFNKSYIVKHFLKVGANTNDIKEICKEITEIDTVKFLIESGVDFNQFVYEISPSQLPKQLVDRFGITEEDNFTLGFYTYMLLKSEARMKESLLLDIKRLNIFPKDTDLLTVLEASIVGNSTLGWIKNCLQNTNQDLSDILSLAITMQKPETLMIELLKLFVDDYGVNLENQSIDEMSLFEQLLQNYQDYNSRVVFEAAKRLTSYKMFAKINFDNFREDKKVELKTIELELQKDKNEIDDNSYDNVVSHPENSKKLDSVILDKIDDEMLIKLIENNSHLINKNSEQSVNLLFDLMDSDYVGNLLRSGGNVDSVIKVMEYYMENGADINAKNQYGNTMLHEMFDSYYFDGEIVENMHFSILNKLISLGADVNVQNNKGVTPLMLACSTEEVILESVKVLIKAGANVNAVTQKGVSPLHCAIIADNNVEITKLLIEHGANINQRSDDDFHEYPLIIEMNYEDYDLFDLLLEAGADVNVRKTRDGQTPLMIAVKEREDHYFFDKLIEYGADIHICDNDNRNILFSCMMRYEEDEGIELYKKFRALGVENTKILMPLEDGSSTRTTLLNLTATFFADYFIETLCEDIDVNITNELGNTPLLDTIHCIYTMSDQVDKQLATIKKLISLGADVNAQNNRGETALTLVAGLILKEFPELRLNVNEVIHNMICELIDAGASITQSIDIAEKLNIDNRCIELLNHYLNGQTINNFAEPELIYQKIGELLWSIFPRDALEVNFDCQLYDTFSQHDFFWIAMNEKGEWNKYSSVDINEEVNFEIEKYLIQLQQHPMFKKEKWTHCRVTVTNKGEFEISFAYIERENAWSGVFMRGISDLTKEEADYVGVPEGIWKEQVEKNKNKEKR